jgi:hypothetical protein
MTEHPSVEPNEPEEVDARELEGTGGKPPYFLEGISDCRKPTGNRYGAKTSSIAAEGRTSE